MQNITIEDAGLICHDGAPAYFEIDYCDGATVGTAHVSLETCFEVLQDDGWQLDAKRGEVTNQVERYNNFTASWRPHTVRRALGDYIAERISEEGVDVAATKILHQLNITA